MNSIMFLDIRKTGSTWIFDDASRGVVAEPFVQGIPAMIDQVILDTLGGPRNNVRIFFSAQQFPGSSARWDWLLEECGGNWYADVTAKKVGWLCPCLGKYFAVAPAAIHLRVEEAA
jgi:hypothetical protein